MMRLAPINFVQILFMALMVACPMIGVDWPKTVLEMQITAMCAAGAFAVVNMYATPIAPATFLTPTGVQTVHIVQGVIGGVIATLNGAVIDHPTLGPTIRVACNVGGIAMGIIGVFSPKALAGPLMIMRMRRAASQPPPPTPKEGLPR